MSCQPWAVSAYLRSHYFHFMVVLVCFLNSGWWCNIKFNDFKLYLLKWKKKNDERKIERKRSGNKIKTFDSWTESFMGVEPLNSIIWMGCGSCIKGIDNFSLLVFIISIWNAVKTITIIIHVQKTASNSNETKNWRNRTTKPN